MSYNPQEAQLLLHAAKQSIQYGLMHRDIMPIQIHDYPDALQEVRGAFVTLHKNQGLRGCIGTLEPHLPLIADVVQNAFMAAFRDPRFPPLTAMEFPECNLDISILSRAEPITFASEADLLRQLRPGIDGLILSDLGHRGTFLPSVWEQLPDPQQFLQHLKNKAGLPASHWSKSIKVERYTTQLIS